MGAIELRRQHPRKAYNTDIIFNLNNRSFAGTLEEYQHGGGAFVMTPSVNQVYKGANIALTIPYTDGTKHIQCRGRVLWTSGEGFAIEFFSNH